MKNRQMIPSKLLCKIKQSKLRVPLENVLVELAKLRRAAYIDQKEHTMVFVQRVMRISLKVMSNNLAANNSYCLYSNIFLLL
ncbi:hypothetical protein RDI58_019968 [Solanum bulbocastanum]|uniref:Uncharacterized protein n=1 Tax=Solanum bulbocastanum TaxID=147425 RepID=A0AAN8Y7F9_SOLBU